jgi:hypothetical protein
MTTLVTAEAFTEADEDEILIPILFASAYCLVSNPLIFESVEDGTRTPMIRRRRKTIDGLLEEYGERGGRMNVFQENHLSGMDHMAKQMVAIVELKTMKKLKTKIKEVSSQIEKKQEKLSTILRGYGK